MDYPNSIFKNYFVESKKFLSISDEFVLLIILITNKKKLIQFINAFIELYQ
jgi:hypothetical protein